MDVETPQNTGIKITRIDLAVSYFFQFIVWVAFCLS
jgi:hypothetical protein